jgi:hypothetical protein
MNSPILQRSALILISGLALAAAFLWALRPEPIRNLRLVSVTKLERSQVPDKYDLDKSTKPIRPSEAMYRIRLKGDGGWV